MLFAVGIGAFGAHSLNQVLTENGTLAVFDTASKYHFYHGLALLVLGAIFDQNEQMIYVKIITNFLFYGVIIFSGSLYILSIFNIIWLGFLTPIGGLFMLIAWLLFVISLNSLKNC